ncbi:hypothetical protein JCM19239_2330 [Vibrio variabilis]|uniref:Uncharacterized protein n=1 Tax=Vibrio variabilis TaxID=990271 RepID=A0ABQ0JB69_9VIBR|nr:hypothetical protein JCM19239_2330 [Vibrio variabilis]
MSGVAFANQELNTQGPTLANQSELSTSISIDEMKEISRFFNQPENKVKIQFPSEKTEFAWVNMSKFYQVYKSLVVVRFQRYLMRLTKALATLSILTIAMVKKSLWTSTSKPNLLMPW